MTAFYWVSKLGVMKYVYYLPNQARPWRFKKSVNGRIVIRNFITKKEAEDYSRSFLVAKATKGAESFFVGEADRKLLADLRKICGTEVDLREVARFWKRHYKPGTEQAVSCEAAFEAFMKWIKNSGRAERTIKTLETTKRKFLKRFSSELVSKIGKDEILSWVNALPIAPRSKKNHIGNITNFLNWCKIAKSWIIDVPKIDERLLPISAKDPVHIWTLEEAEYAIRHIEKHERPYLAHYVLRMFAGLRTSEASQMRWEWIDFDNRKITVPAHVCKTRDAWVILPEFCPATVWEWLLPLRQESGAVHKPAEKARTRIANACQWKPNVLRHTFATMHVALYGDEAKTIFATRHTNVATLRAHYKGVNQTRTDAEKFFALRPVL